MKACAACSQFYYGICSIYKKEPPAGFAERCRHYQGPDFKAPEPVNGCEQCHRFDRDDTGNWCINSAGQIIRFVKLPTDEPCPIK